MVLTGGAGVCAAGKVLTGAVIGACAPGTS